MTARDDVFLGLFAFLLQFLSSVFLILLNPLFAYTNFFLPVGVFFLSSKERFFLRVVVLFGLAGCLDFVSFSPFGFWFFRMALLVGSIFLWIEVFSTSFFSLGLFLLVYPFVELLLEAVVLRLVYPESFLSLPALEGRVLSAFLGPFLFRLWSEWWRREDVE
ncbi:MAG: hypothetical protein ACUVTO_00770 [Candidatus Caldatribacteriaceae bacterium]